MYAPLCVFWIRGLAKQRALQGAPEMLCLSTSEGETVLEGKQTPASPAVKLFGKPHSFLFLTVTNYG